MYWENLVFDAARPSVDGVYWEKLLSSETLTDNAGGFETRLQFSDHRYLDLCFPRVTDATSAPQRYFPVLTDQRTNDPIHVDSGSVPRVVRTDHAGREFVVSRSSEGSGPLALAAIEVHSADPTKDAEFWAQMTGWKPSVQEATTLEHPSKTGPSLRIVAQNQPKSSAKSPVHIDLRLEPDDDIDQIVSDIEQLGGTELHHEWGEVPWRIFLDPSGNEFCILPALAAGD